MIPDTLHIGPIPIHVFGLCSPSPSSRPGSAGDASSRARGTTTSSRRRRCCGRRSAASSAPGCGSSLEDWPSFVRDPIELPLHRQRLRLLRRAARRGARGDARSSAATASRGCAGADAVAPAIVLGQAIGRHRLSALRRRRLGRGDDACPGAWRIRTRSSGGRTSRPGVRVHPTPVYETRRLPRDLRAPLALAAQRPQPDGTIFAGIWCWRAARASWSSSCASIRVVAFGLTAAQLTSLVLVAIGVALLLAEAAMAAGRGLKIALGDRRDRPGGGARRWRRSSAGRPGDGAGLRRPRPRRPGGATVGAARPGGAAEPLDHVVPAVPRGDAVDGAALPAAARPRLRAAGRQPGRGRPRGGARRSCATSGSRSRSWSIPSTRWAIATGSGGIPRPSSSTARAASSSG